MAGKGGGSWKVAYADFVTAMMAFFLVMWIGAQDQKTRQSVANYFVDPSGVSKKPARSGAVYDALNSGSVAMSESTATGRGRNSHSSDEHSPATKLVDEWIHTDKKANKYWRDQAKRNRENAARSEEVLTKKNTVEEVATKQLAKQLREEITKGIAGQASSLYQDMLLGTFSEVNWTELAEDLLAN